MAEILPIWRKTLSNQSINQSNCRFWYLSLVNKLFFFSAAERLIEKEPSLVNAAKSDGNTALHITAINDHVDTANILILKVSRIKVLMILQI